MRGCYEAHRAWWRVVRSRKDSSMYARSSLCLFATASLLAGCVGAGSSPSTAPDETVDNDLAAGTTFSGSGDNKTQSPIKHVIVIIGENRTFDHVFATYQPKHGQQVD